MSVIALQLLTACDVIDGDRTPSSDLAALRAKVHVDLPISSVVWEVFGTPEYIGGVPGATDIQTLVAEIVLIDATYPSKMSLPLANEVFVVPESPRAWLSPEFKTMMNRVRNSSEDMGRSFGCFRYETLLTDSGQPVSGFLCFSAARALLYLTLDKR